jgi:hypothetical protein
MKAADERVERAVVSTLEEKPTNATTGARAIWPSGWACRHDDLAHLEGFPPAATPIRELQAVEGPGLLVVRGGMGLVMGSS